MAEHHPRQRRSQNSHRSAPPDNRPNGSRSSYGNNYANGPRSSPDRQPRAYSAYPQSQHSSTNERVQPTHYSQIEEPPMNRCPACRGKVPAGGLELHRRECNRKT